MKNWIVFGLAFICIVMMLLVGLNALEKNQEQMGLLLTFAGSMSIIGLAIDIVQHVRTRRTM